MSALWIAAVCLVAIVFFSAAEMAFIAANRLRLRHLAEEGSGTAAAYLEVFRHPERPLSAAMMGVTIADIVAASAATWALLPVLGHAAPLVVTAVLTPVMLVFGEIIPKAAAREWATRLILWLYRPLMVAAWVLAPVVTLATAITAALLRLFGVRDAATRHFVSREELKALLSVEPGEADVTTQEAEMIDKIFDLGNTAVREVMVPLVDAVMLEDTATPADAIALIHQRGYSRIPIWHERESSVVGMVAAMDLLRLGAEARSLDALMRPPYYVPEAKRIDDLLREMQRARNPMAIVVDEYGATTGLVTLEDVVEEIVGEIEDEHDRAPASVERLPDGSYWVAARVHIDELNESLEWNLPKQDYETVGGLVLATLGRIPRTGEEFQVRGYTITVLEADARRVAAVKIVPARPAARETA
ncbi:MAG: HlyC/CorC family transporter [Candidatus Rokubacteria bacterium]|nr:HlyC/CorC family transporter [Candidatus Rokubacteria bacterium]MBI3825524.1 HlyC/CorC family transporter [Candidatus Rokubacteria bacterium]